MTSTWISHTFGGFVSALEIIVLLGVVGFMTWRLFMTGVWFDGDIVRIQRLFNSVVLSRSHCVCVQLKKAKMMDLQVWIQLDDGRQVLCPIRLFDIDIPGQPGANSFIYSGLGFSRKWRLEALGALAQQIPLSPEWARRFAEVVGP